MLINADSNATTSMSPATIKEMTRWFNIPGGENTQSNEAYNCLDKFRAEICNRLGCSVHNHTVVFTSGGSEGNAFVLTSTVLSYRQITNKTPHVVISQVEHSSVTMCLQRMEMYGLCQVTAVAPRQWGSSFIGRVEPAAVRQAIRPNTCLISIMAANNETGVLNNILEISSIAHKNGIPFHTDAVQVSKTDIQLGCADAITLSFHKCHGPLGAGAVILSSDFLKEFKLQSLIAGMQNGKLRGGTENIPALLGAREAWNLLTPVTATCKAAFISTLLDKKIELVRPPAYRPGFRGIVLITPDFNMVLYNTIMLVISPPVCNQSLKKRAEEKGVVFGLGSACYKGKSNTGDILGIPKDLQKSILRISFDLFTKPADAVKAANVLLKVILELE